MYAAGATLEVAATGAAKPARAAPREVGTCGEDVAAGTRLVAEAAATGRARRA